LIQQLRFLANGLHRSRVNTLNANIGFQVEAFMLITGAESACSRSVRRYYIRPIFSLCIECDPDVAPVVDERTVPIRFRGGFL
jgi:hypothetical protein